MKANSSAWMRLAAAVACAGGLWTVSSRPVTVTAQGGLTITSPANNAILAAGPDYATEVLGDPWDFSNPQDIALDPGQVFGWASPPTVSGGIFNGTTSVSSNVYVGLVQRPYYLLNNPGRTGQNFPVDTAKYSKLSMRVTSNVGDQFPRVYWFHHGLGDPADNPGTRLLVTAPVTPPAGTRIAVIDLTNTTDFGGVQGGATWGAAPQVKGLWFYPNHGNTSNSVQIDWVRLTSGDARPEAKIMNIAWTGGSGSVNVTVTPSGGPAYTIATSQPGSGGSINWNYGVLPPGSYTLNVGAVSRSFTVNAPPLVKVTDPDETGGEDFATTVLGNVWDMKDANDYVVSVNIVDHLSAKSTDANGFHGTSDGVMVSNPPPAGDPQVYFHSKQTPASGPVIDSNKYHRLTYNLRVNRPFSLGEGSVARILWGSTATQTGGGAPYTNVTVSKDILVWPGTNSYTLDLAAMTVANGGLENVNGGIAWNAFNIRHLRLDPFEFPEVVTFDLVDVKLAADDQTSSGSFLIKFSGSDPEGDSTTLALYYDTDQNPTNGMTLITSGIPLANGQYKWLTGTTVPAGLYYIYYVANDGRNSVARYSSGPVRVVSAPLPITGGDFDGVARFDMALYKANGDWAVLKSGSSFTQSFTQTWGGAGYTAVPGDYDGDGKQDLGVYRDSTGVWSILRSSSNYTTTLTINLGGPGDRPVQGDYDGDGKTDAAIYRQSTAAWTILKSSGGTINAAWGGIGYVPVGGQDFDGDGRADIGVYQTATGTWSVLRSSSNYTTTLGATWGGGGYTLVPGDYDADGKADFGLYEPATGTWKILKSSSGYSTSLIIGWGGGGGYLPVPGDYEGDGVTDIAVFQRSSGNWLVLRSSTNFTTSFTINGWGAATDLPLSAAIPTGSNETTRPTDFDRDVRSDITVYQESTANWLSLTSTSNYNQSQIKAWGGAGYTPVPGDYDGDGKTDYGAYQPSTGTWVVLLSGANYTTALNKVVGGSAWLPVPGDYDADGRTDPVVYNPTTGLWFGLKSGSNYTTSISVTWGGPGYTAAPGDFDGDGRGDLSLYQQASGNWYVLLSGANFTTSLSRPAGGPAWTPVQGDYDNDGKTDFGVYNASTGQWFVLKSSSNYTTTVAMTWGGPSYTPVRGDYDADGRQDLALHQGSSGNWYILLSSANFTTSLVKQWGPASSGYAPLPRFP